MNDGTKKNENLKPKETLHSVPFLQPFTDVLKVAVPKILENFLEKPMLILVSVAPNRPSYLRTMNCTACLPGNFEAAISPKILS